MTEIEDFDGSKIRQEYNALNRPSKIIDALGRETILTYDAMWNLARITDPSGAKSTFIYNEYNRLGRIRNANRDLIRYKYDAVGNRTQVEDTIDLTKQYHNLLQRREDNNTTAYTWDSNVLHAMGAGTDISEQNSNNYQYLQDELGSPIRLLAEEGIEQEVYGYDEFGQETIGNHHNNHNNKENFTQPFTYTGYQKDDVANTCYAQAREYKAGVGRFTGEDAIRAGRNWYIYCNNDPLMNIDPLGLEEIVISGGIYSATKRENDAYYYEFIDAGLAQINELNQSSSDENITWIIADHGWSDLNKSEFQKAADYEGVNLVFASNGQQVVNYLNYQTTTNRRLDGGVSNARQNDQVTNLSVFSHGLATNNGTIFWGYDYSTGNETLNITTSDIYRIRTAAFARNINTEFYSCNTGTAGSDSFAQLWANRFGGVTIAYKGQTDYAGVADNSLSAKIARRLTQLICGVSAFGRNPSLPIAGSDAERLTFMQECID